MALRGSVPAVVAVLGLIVGLAIGGAAVAVFTGRLAGFGGAIATTVTRTVTETSAGGQISTMTSTITQTQAAPTATTTVTTTSSRGATMDVQPTQLLFYAGSSITVFGTVTPPPTSTQGVVVTIRNPQGAAVSVGQAQVSSSTGAFSFVIGASGTTGWQRGEYSVYVSAGTMSATTVFYFSPSRPPASDSTLSLQVLAPTVVAPGDQSYVAVLATLANGVPDDLTSWSALTVLFPDGTFHDLCTTAGASAGCTGTFSRVQVGFYEVIFTLPTNAQHGTYFVEAGATDASGNSARTLGQFSVP